GERGHAERADDLRRDFRRFDPVGHRPLRCSYPYRSAARTVVGAAPGLRPPGARDAFPYMKTNRAARLLAARDLPGVFVDFEQHDQQLAPDARADRAADHDGDRLDKMAEAKAVAEHYSDPGDQRAQKQQPVNQGDDFWREHGIEEKQI